MPTEERVIGRHRGHSRRSASQRDAVDSRRQAGANVPSVQADKAVLRGVDLPY